MHVGCFTYEGVRSRRQRLLGLAWLPSIATCAPNYREFFCPGEDLVALPQTLGVRPNPPSNLAYLFYLEGPPLTSVYLLALHAVGGVSYILPFGLLSLLLWSFSIRSMDHKSLSKKRALGGIWAPRRPKVQKRVDFDLPPAPQRDPFGSLFGTFSSLGPSWDLKMMVFGGGLF